MDGDAHASPSVHQHEQWRNGERYSGAFCSAQCTLFHRYTVTGGFFLLIGFRLSQYYQRLDALRWTPYLDECVAVLAGNEDLPTDTLLAHLIKLQLIVEDVGRAPWHEGYDDATGSARAPPTFYLKALQAQLHAFKAKIPPGIQRNGKGRS